MTTGSRQLWMRLFLPFAAGYFLSYLYRTANAVIGPVLARDLGLADNAPAPTSSPSAPLSYRSAYCSTASAHAVWRLRCCSSPLPEQPSSPCPVRSTDWPSDAP